MEINAMFRDATLSPLDFKEMLAKEARVVAALSEKEPSMSGSNWRLKGNTAEEAKLYPAFDENGQPSAAALAVLAEKARRKKTGSTFAAIWNEGASEDGGAAMACHVSEAKIVPDRVSLSIDEPSCFRTTDEMVDIIKSIVDAFDPLVVEASPKGYFEKQVFDDKPGVGWMLYLPKVITAQQVPEAHAMIPVPESGKRQTGTIIVSVADAVFSVDNPEHIEVANRVEIRLVDQDLLPAYSEF
ncbi:immunity 52 family protein [Paraburkholderia tropica]|uniref:immunity 52 family protein n=1 Tax=Paraburkholderia tropica TaxID=92647 RepID=UPI002AB13AD0|nr:immunity 52 family protein [Paraburkholderia tropica]